MRSAEDTEHYHFAKDCYFDRMMAKKLLNCMERAWSAIRYCIYSRMIEVSVLIRK